MFFFQGGGGETVPVGVISILQCGIYCMWLNMVYDLCTCLSLGFLKYVFDCICMYLYINIEHMTVLMYLLMIGIVLYINHSFLSFSHVKCHQPKWLPIFNSEDSFKVTLSYLLSINSR